MKTVIPILAVSSIVLAVFITIMSFSNLRLRGELGVTKHDLKQANETIQVNRDSIRDFEDRLEFLRMILIDRVGLYQDSLNEARAATTKWKTEYAKAKKYRLPDNVSDAGLDSLITDLIRARTND